MLCFHFHLKTRVIWPERKFSLFGVGNSRWHRLKGFFVACVILLFIGSFPGVWYVLPNRSLIHSWQVAGPLDASWLPLDLALSRRCADACDEVLGAPDSLCEVAISTAPAGDGYKPVRALVVIARLLPAFPLARNGASSPAASDPDLIPGASQGWFATAVGVLCGGTDTERSQTLVIVELDVYNVPGQDLSFLRHDCGNIAVALNTVLIVDAVGSSCYGARLAAGNFCRVSDFIAFEPEASLALPASAGGRLAREPASRPGLAAVQDSFGQRTWRGIR